MSNNIIEINNLSMSYGENEVLKGISLQVGKGQIIGCIGRGITQINHAG